MTGQPMRKFIIQFTVDGEVIGSAVVAAVTILDVLAGSVRFFDQETAEKVDSLTIERLAEDPPELDAEFFEAAKLKEPRQ